MIDQKKPSSEPAAPSPLPFCISQEIDSVGFHIFDRNCCIKP